MPVVFLDFHTRLRIDFKAAKKKTANFLNPMKDSMSDAEWLNHLLTLDREARSQWGQEDAWPEENPVPAEVVNLFEDREAL